MRLNDYEIDHLAAIRPGLAECAVLLRRNGDFPLKEPCPLALYGSGARHTVKGGTGSGEVNSRFFVTAEQGLREAGFSITTNTWLDGYDAVLAAAERQFLRDVKARARERHTLAVVEGMGAVMPAPEYDLALAGAGDTAVYVLSRICGEGNDRRLEKGDLLLSDTERREILALRKQYAKFLLVLNVGGPVDLSDVPEVENVLLLSQLGVETGRVLADLLLGRAYPSGKLTTTWAAAQDLPAIGDFGGRDETRYREGVYMGYRYFDTVGKRALFPFGFGLGYTDFSFSPGAVSLAGETVSVPVTVKNTGAFPGKETVQVYVSVPWGQLDQPYQTLAGFQKSRELAPGEQETLTVTFSLRDLSSFDTERAAYVLEAGDYVVRAGVSSVDTVPCAVLRLGETIPVRQVKNLLGAPDFADWRPERPRTEPLPAQTPVLPVDAGAIARETVSYESPEEIDEAARTLSDEDLALLNIGAFDPRGGILSVIGNAAFSVAGAAGETCGKLRQRGIPPVVMADGPAGLRIAPEIARDESGVYSLGPSMPESISQFLPPALTGLLRLLQKKPGRDAVRSEQYCTAIPIGTALAQSWNPDFARLCGDVVGSELERFGVHLWLAPALNLHRDPRCGRNFEYFSEDPLVSGVFAAALTESVQAHPGRGVTIKHFAANNQETNRYYSNSQVSQRALRELYLRGFEICIRAAQPLALMTSYNLLNGEHTAQRRDLIEDVLRREFGFRGLVMTDWVTAVGTMDKSGAHGGPEAWKVAAAGGDLFMPGSPGDYRNVRRALRDGRLSRRQLERNVTRLLRLIRQTVEHGK